MLNSFSQSVIVNTDEALRRTVLLNLTRGNSLFADDQEMDQTNDDEPMTRSTVLFLVNRSTELIGQYL